MIEAAVIYNRQRIKRNPINVPLLKKSIILGSDRSRAKDTPTATTSNHHFSNNLGS
jgi:hypothetical protein